MTVGGRADTPPARAIGRARPHCKPKEQRESFVTGRRRHLVPQRRQQGAAGDEGSAQVSPDQLRVADRPLRAAPKGPSLPGEVPDGTFAWSAARNWWT